MVLRSLLAGVIGAALSSAALGQTYTWNQTGNGSWTDSASWNPNSAFPNSSTDEAIFGDIISSTASVSMGGGVTVNRLTFDGITGTKAYTIGTSTITLGGTAAAITSNATVTSTGEQAFTSVIAGSGDLTVNGGRLLLSNDVSTFGGNVSVNTGRLRIQPSNQHDRPLGSSANSVTVASGGQLFNDAQGFNEMPYALSISGNGVAGAPTAETGALRFGGFSPSRWTGLITLSANASIRFSGSAAVRGGVDLGSNTLTFLGSVSEVGIVDLNAIAGAGNVIYNAKSTTVSVDSTYTGTTQFQSGFTFINTPNSLGQSLGTAANKALVESGAKLYLNGSSPLTVGNKMLTLNGGELVGNSDVKSWEGPIDLTAPSLIGAEGISGNLTVSGGISNGGNLLTLRVNFTDSLLNVNTVGISGSGGLQVTSPTTPGLVRLNATGDYTGTTTIASGRLAVNAVNGTGNGTVTVNGGTLLGVGTIAGATTVGNNGTISAGDPIQTNTRGNLTLANGLAFSGNGTFAWKLGALSTANPGTDFDVLTVSGGNLALGGSSRLTLDFSSLGANTPNSSDPFWATSRQWTIVDLTGTATNNGSTWFGNITNPTYTSGSFTTIAQAGDVILKFTAVPEPTTLMATAGIGVLFSYCLRRRKRRRDGDA